ncbi:MAG: hypothetical protein QXP77_00135 [Candidatus Aenigmatarchaeota archaeon]
MEKGVAIPYIVALVIGLIVIVFIVYWVYRSFGGQGVSCSDCKSQFIDWCTRCAMVNKGSNTWTINAGGGAPLCARGGNCSFCTTAPYNCNSCQNDCKSVGVEPL